MFARKSSEHANQQRLVVVMLIGTELTTLLWHAFTLNRILDNKIILYILLECIVMDMILFVSFMYINISYHRDKGHQNIYTFSFFL